MRAGAQLLHELDEVVDVVVEPEGTGFERHVARVVPVGDVDVVVRQQRANGVAQQRGEVARQRRHDQHARLRDVDVLLEPQQGAERQRQHRLLGHLDLAVTDRDGRNTVLGAGVGQPGAGDQLVGGGQVANDGDIALDAPGTEHRQRLAGQGLGRLDQVVVGLIGEVEHLVSLLL